MGLFNVPLHWRIEYRVTQALGIHDAPAALKAAANSVAVVTGLLVTSLLLLLAALLLARGIS